MSRKKSEIIKKLSDNYPNFIKKDLIKFIEIITTEIKNSLRRKERVELRDVFSIEPRLQKRRISRNPRTNEKVLVKEKDKVQEGDNLLILDAMKMENIIKSDFNGTIKKISVKENQSVSADEMLITFD